MCAVNAKNWGMLLVARISSMLLIYAFTAITIQIKFFDSGPPIILSPQEAFDLIPMSPNTSNIILVHPATDYAVGCHSFRH